MMVVLNRLNVNTIKLFVCEIQSMGIFSLYGMVCQKDVKVPIPYMYQYNHDELVHRMASLNLFEGDATK